MIGYFLNPFSIIIYLYHKIFNLLKLVKELKKIFYLILLVISFLHMLLNLKKNLMNFN